MNKNTVNEIENISLSAKQIKSKLEDSLAYDHNKYHNEILFNTKPNAYYKLPFSDFKIAISEEIANQQLLLENLHQYISEVRLIEENPEEEELEIVEEVEMKEENDINIIEEVYEFDEIEEDIDDEKYIVDFSATSLAEGGVDQAYDYMMEFNDLNNLEPIAV